MFFLYVAASDLVLFMRDPSLWCTVVHRLQLCPRGSAVATHRLYCSAARGILSPQPGPEPTVPALEGRFLATGPPEKSP